MISFFFYFHFNYNFEFIYLFFFNWLSTIFFLVSFWISFCFCFCLHLETIQSQLSATIMVDRCAYVKMLVKSRADSTAKTYLVEIRKFFAWCKQNPIADSHPFYSTVVFSSQ